jgi:hypothetical protein
MAPAPQCGRVPSYCPVTVIPEHRHAFWKAGLESVRHRVIRNRDCTRRFNIVHGSQRPFFTLLHHVCVHAGERSVGLRRPIPPRATGARPRALSQPRHTVEKMSMCERTSASRAAYTGVNHVLAAPPTPPWLTREDESSGDLPISVTSRPRRKIWTCASTALTKGQGCPPRRARVK